MNEDFNPNEILFNEREGKGEIKTPTFRLATSLLRLTDLPDEQLDLAKDSISAHCSQEQAVLADAEQEVLTSMKFSDETLQEQYRENLDTLVDQGFLSRETVQAINNDLLDPSKIRATQDLFSGYSYNDLVLPSETIGYEISTKHVAFQLNFLKQAVNKAGLSDKVGIDKLVEISSKQAVAHEFAHALETYISVKLAEQKPPDIQTLRQDTGRRNELYALWDDVDAEIANKFFGEYSNIEALASTFDAQGLVGMHKEALAKSFEVAILYAELLSLGLGIEDASKVIGALMEQYAQSLDDFVKFSNEADDRGIDHVKYDKTINDLELVGLRDRLPYYGLESKQAGYYIALTPGELKNFSAEFTL